MEPKYYRQTKPFRVPTIDNKLIEEHFGLASTRTGAFSVAHMVAPPNWSEPHQKPAFDEITIVIRGRKQIEVDGDVIELNAGETLLVKAGARVKYSNPFDEESEYWSVCVPAFDINTVNREGE
ncbi:cupin domain-containing protein [Adhaeribacter pallidiroseus]|uniref:Endoribonuclease YbeY n=1 Tax=Adhaeribacter pallidiroseus TaxID=2072847 RepID=A0A369QMT6_9BACT|nr:cupin domain-containing protein [Adhaeribacter pallidiroseus]RDC66054.1 Endoribonuclease YbeY [Adhaeribacter pallidiroseus]